ncbi:hypothetical protein [Streptomyces sp. NPDC098781]|uniref:hypothetical protein n=1 Tax=Streptomyces sp. NPDC098781 TaxID=3366097 RepID=UPI003819EB16
MSYAKIPLMDLQGLGAIAAAAVAAATVPITVLVGRWQVRAAVQAAEAAYRAAVDAAQRQGTDAHAQWRREVRREAYTAFLLAVHQVTRLANAVEDDYHNENPDSTADMERAVTALQNAFFVVLLEGPDSAAVAANALSDAVGARTQFVLSQAAYAGAWMSLIERHRREREANRTAGAVTTQEENDTHARRILDALQELSAASDAASCEDRHRDEGPFHEALQRFRASYEPDVIREHYGEVLYFVTDGPDLKEKADTLPARHQEFMVVARAAME